MAVGAVAQKDGFGINLGLVADLTAVTGAFNFHRVLQLRASGWCRLRFELTRMRKRAKPAVAGRLRRRARRHGVELTAYSSRASEQHYAKDDNGATSDHCCGHDRD